MTEMVSVTSGPTPTVAVTAATPIVQGQFDYIDAVRGWAIFLVITCHVGGAFKDLPYPLRKMTDFGWHGVQMFFLASAVTLAMSWHRQKATGSVAIQNFFIRRFLRIAPMYYLGALIYLLIMPPVTGFDLAQMLRSFLFINAWHPDWVSTTQGWTVVPGGWSIGVEFTFYALFPFLITILTTLPRALGFLALSLVLALVLNHYGLQWLEGYDPFAVRNFLYFWFPNQLPVFALGIALYHVIVRYRFALNRSATYAAIAVAVFMCVVAIENPVDSNYFQSLTAIPTIYVAAIAFAIFILGLANGPKNLFTNKFIRRLGVLSFSSYVLHFLFIEKIPGWLGRLIDIQAAGYNAIFMFGCLWIISMTATVAAAAVFHTLIEQPSIDLAHRLTSGRGKPL